MKILQYMACGIPVVASPVGVNKNIITHGVNGLLATRAGEWTTALRSLIADPKLRQQLGAAGRETVTKHFHVGHAAEAVNSVLRSLA